MTAASKGPTLSVVPDPTTDTLSGPPELQPSGWPTPPGYANGMAADGRLVVTGGALGDAALAQTMQDHVKQTIAPYKYPRAVEFVAQLPKTETGKLRRFALRQMAANGPASPGIAAE